MSKLPQEYKFLDLSDYGRMPARWIAIQLKDTSVTPIHLTTCFIVSGLVAVICIYLKLNYFAAFFLILKSVLDAADGELSRVKNTPSYVGRYYDSIADICLNFLFLLVLWYSSIGSIFYMLAAFVGIQLQGTLYNYYYVIQRNRVEGDLTSRVFEDKAPIAIEGENQKTVNVFYKIYDFLYISFDKTIYYLDRTAMDTDKPFSKWFMTSLSIFGLGFQLLLIAVMLLFNLEHLVIPFFIAYSLFIFVFIGIRRWFLN